MEEMAGQGIFICLRMATSYSGNSEGRVRLTNNNICGVQLQQALDKELV